MLGTRDHRRQEKQASFRQEKAALALSHYEPPAMRQQIFHAGGVTVVDDTYNASPDSVHTAVQLLARLGAQGRKIAVLADMLELGEKSYEGHYDCGAFCAENGVEIGRASCRERV